MDENNSKTLNEYKAHEKVRCEYCGKEFYTQYDLKRCPECIRANYGKEIIEEAEE